MARNKRKGYMAERKVRMLLEKAGWLVMRAGGSLGEADLACFKNKKCIFLQVKSSKKDTFYYYGHMKDSLAGFPFYLIVDFGYGRIRATTPVKKVGTDTGKSIAEFVRKFI